MKEISFYIHIPFCIRKCGYCDFLSVNDLELIPRYMAALQNEISAFESGAPVKSIFIGGGTPSALDSRYIRDMLDSVSKRFNIQKNCEISIETNPGTLTEQKLADYRAAGINRLSMGVQSLDDRLLKLIGRIHDRRQALENFALAKKYFENINLDLMFALPRQSLDDWAKTLETAVSMAPTHISAYSLILEEGTPFYERFSAADEELDRRMYHHARAFLAENGYLQYEISNFAKKGHECRHNLVYWQGGEYKGFGLGAASLLNQSRLKNTEDFGEYFGGTTVAETISLDKSDLAAEFVILGLRCTGGISAADFKERFGADIFSVYGETLKKHEKGGLLAINGDNIRLTPKGMDLSNMVFVDII